MISTILGLDDKEWKKMLAPKLVFRDFCAIFYGHISRFISICTGEHSYVYFLVWDGDAKEVLPAHQLILKNASDVFEEMFRCNAKKKRTENASVNCPVVEVPDVEAAAFKVMLSFIYIDDLNELNGDNAMAVLYAGFYQQMFSLHLPKCGAIVRVR
ncbi:hypothetical protein niasHS_008904 [Heterodera schachtii]|uniref:BTB domain-containing protein n=1 Tax=Heterodera schachtii TaxID=97005 RepID=A0ABD2J3D6_HETSC